MSHSVQSATGQEPPTTHAGGPATAGDDRVPRWAAGREVELFARAFDRQLTV